MMRIFLNILVFGLGLQLSVAQDIYCSVQVEAKQTGRTQLSIFNTLEKSLEEFINNRNWTNRNLPVEQRVNCNMYISINSYSENEMEGSLQIQSSRPVYGAAYTTPMFNYKDPRFSFSYEENQPLVFNPNSFENNLVSIISFYVYVMMGLDADSFSPEGGASSFSMANQIVSLAQQGGRSGWSASSGSNSRYELNRQLQSSSLAKYHEALYVYHRKGLDEMHQDAEEGKQQIAEAMNLLYEVNGIQSNSILLRTFFDAKAREVASVFNGGPPLSSKTLVSQLRSMAPAYDREWRTIPSK